MRKERVRVLTAASLLVAALGVAAFADPDGHPKVPNVVLVHGAWADGSSWGGVIQRLQKAGYHVTAVQLALASLDADAANVRNVLSMQTGPTLLVAHSYGGAVITKLGPAAPNVVGIVYESAFAPAEGESMKAIVSQGPPPPGAAAIGKPDKLGFLWLDPAGFRQFFAPDVDADQERVMAAAQKPLAASAFMSDAKFGPPAWRSFPTWYIVTEQDQMIPPDGQRLFAKRMGATVSSVAASHVAMVSHPEEVAAIIMKAAQSGRTKLAVSSVK
jgi:pimeloyl-ACP methyl ester carboxylesterase